MSAAALGPGLDELRSGLEGLLSCFEGQPFPEPSAMDAAWTRVLRTFERVRTELEGRPALAPEFQGRLETCLQLYAVATGMLARHREELVTQRSACSNARVRLRRRAAGRASGDSCDVSA